MEQQELHLRFGHHRVIEKAVQLLADEYVVLMSGDHPHAHTELTLERYLDLSHIKVSPYALGTAVIDDALADRGLRRHVAITVPSWFEMRNVVAGTDLVVAMPRRWRGHRSSPPACVVPTAPAPGHLHRRRAPGGDGPPWTGCGGCGTSSSAPSPRLRRPNRIPSSRPASRT